MAITSTTANGRRRTQAQRSAATREALLDAALECLVEDGYANTTTSRVAERAGVSRGAHLHHFGTRNALVAAAVQHLTERRGEELRAEVDRLPTNPRRRLEAGLDLLWANYANPLFQAALDLWTHARTDSELREHLLDVERLFDRQTVELARCVFPAQAEREDFEALLEMAVASVRGLALLDTLHPTGQRNGRQWPRIRALLVELFEG